MKPRAVLGLVGGLLLLASSLAHAFLGWPQIRDALAAAGTEPQLVGALAVGWHFGSVAMAAFGVIVTAIAVARLRGRAPSILPAAVVAVTYLAFGTGALIARHGSPHFLAFLVLGLLVGALAFHRAPPAAG